MKKQTESFKPEAGPAEKEDSPFKTDPKVFRDNGRLLEELTRSAGKDAPGALKDAGESYLHGKSPGDAERVLRESTEQEPDDAQAHSLLATALAGQGRYEEAMESARKALSIDPNEPRALELVDYLRSAVPKTGARWDLSRVGFGSASPPEQAQAASPGGGASTAPGGRQAGAGTAPAGVTEAEKIMRVARRKLGLGDLEGALVDASRAIQADPRDARALALRAAVSNRLKNYKSALADADAALRLDPDSVDALLERSYALYQLGDYASAWSAADAAARLAPGHALARLYRGQAAEKLGRGPEALED